MPPDDAEWFRKVWCEPQGHKHDTWSEIGCLGRALGALRGEEPELREQLLAAATRYGQSEALPKAWSRAARPPARQALDVVAEGSD